MKTNHQFKQSKDKSFIINLTISAVDIQHEYQHVLREIQANFEKKGFRKGKAPLDVVEQNISPQTVIEEVLNHLLPVAYREIVEEHHLKPITEPTIKILSEKLSLDTDWELELSSVELPEVVINKNLYLDIKKLNLEKNLDVKEKNNKIISLILRHTEVLFPEIIINNDINRRLSELVEQLQSAKLTVNDYLKNKKTTLPEYRKELEKQIKDDWSLNLAINQISLDQKLEVDKKELDEVFAKSPELKNDPNLVYYLLTQQKVLNYLQNIV